MANIIEGKLNAKGKKFGIVISRFNELISSQLLSGAKDCLLRHDCKEEDITVSGCLVRMKFHLLQRRWLIQKSLMQ